MNRHSYCRMAIESFHPTVHFVYYDSLMIHFFFLCSFKMSSVGFFGVFFTRSGKKKNTTKDEFTFLKEFQYYKKSKNAWLVPFSIFNVPRHWNGFHAFHSQLLICVTLKKTQGHQVTHILTPEINHLCSLFLSIIPSTNNVLVKPEVTL